VFGPTAILLEYQEILKRNTAIFAISLRLPLRTQQKVSLSTPSIHNIQEWKEHYFKIVQQQQRKLILRSSENDTAH
jgi:hypothetical protein